jgi:hypothetical protein
MTPIGADPAVPRMTPIDADPAVPRMALIDADCGVAAALRAGGGEIDREPQAPHRFRACLWFPIDLPLSTPAAWLPWAGVATPRPLIGPRIPLTERRLRGRRRASRTEGGATPWPLIRVIRVISAVRGKTASACSAPSAVRRDPRHAKLTRHVAGARQEPCAPSDPRRRAASPGAGTA